MTNVKSNLVPDEIQTQATVTGSKVYDPALIKRLVKHQFESGKSWNMLGDNIGISASILSQWKSKKYNGNVGEINSLVEKYLRVEDQKLNAPAADLKFVSIKNNDSCLNVLNTALTDGIIACIIGDTGTSKTMSIKQFIKDNNCIYIHANRTYRWPVEYLRRLHTHRFVGKDGIGTMNKLAMDIIRELHGKNVVIIIDQADYLNLGAIDIFRTINEDCGVGVVFVGLPSFLSKIRGNQPEVRQVRDRIKVRVELKRFSESDCKKILDVNYPGLNGYSKDFYSLSNGSVRILSSLVYNVRKMVGTGKYALDQKTIYDAAKLLERSVVE